MPQIKVTWEDDDGTERTAEIPAVYEVCPECRGEGSTYLGWRSCDQPAFTREDFDLEGPDFFEDYINHRYDRECPECKGRRVVPVPNENACTKEQREALEMHYEQLRIEAEIEAEIRAEQRYFYGC